MGSRTPRSRKNTYTAVAAFLLLFLWSCGVPKSEEARNGVVEAVESFFDALVQSDREALRSIAPEIATLDEPALDEIARSIADLSGVVVGSPEIDRRRAIVPVELSDDNGTPATTIVVPLTWRRGRWMVDKTLAVTRTIDFVPISE